MIFVDNLIIVAYPEWREYAVIDRRSGAARFLEGIGTADITTRSPRWGRFPQLAAFGVGPVNRLDGGGI